MGAKTEAKEIMADFQRVHRELGHIPSRVEYQKHGKFPGIAITEVFGSYALLLRAAGLNYSKGKRSKQEIRQQYHEHLEREIEQRKAAVTPPKLIHRLLCISDFHAPYQHPDALSFLFALHKRFQFDHILCGGDEVDFHALSFHDSDPDLLSAGFELERAKQQLVPLFETFPYVDVLESNHGSLVYRKGKHHGMPRQVLKGYNEILGAPTGWKWREEFVYQFSNGHKAVAHHGYSSNTLLASQKRAMSLIQFHFHNDLSIRYWQNREGLFWALQSGCLIDDTSLAMAYNKLTVARPIIGCAGVIEGHPRLFPMPIDRNGRWTKKLP